ncbi:MAG: tRNA lysidine(34) synthetase TilS, partial [Tangfeifania sp.]
EKSGFNYGVAHCNFQLRGSESDADEKFVREAVLQHGVPAFFQTFETEEHARINGISVEMAARELRYDFFEKVRADNHFDFIATAHHQDDLMETFFLNLSRKTGIKGLTGIKVKSGKIIRPLMFAGRSGIEQYAMQHSIDFRDDSTNIETVFQRNFIRHNIIPLFTQLNPAFKKNFLATIQNLKSAEDVFSERIEMWKQKVMQQTTNGAVIDISRLLSVSFPEILLYEILADYQFNPSVAGQVFQSLGTDSGKQFYSSTYRLVKDREKLFVTELPDDQKRIFYIEKDDIELVAPFDLTIEKRVRRDFKIIKKKEVACLDYDKLEFPLLIRKWQQGDYFQPLGMTGFKKLSDFFIDEKIPLHEKENTWLLCSGQKIVWIMGHRIDNRFKITSGTSRICQITIQPDHPV